MTPRSRRTDTRKPCRVLPPTPYLEDPVRGVDLLDSLGNETTAFGSVVWLGGRHREGLSLFAVLSPVASRIAPGLADSWRQRGVRVFVAEDRKAERVARALGRWPTTQLRLHRSDRGLSSLDPQLRERLAGRAREVAFRQLARAFVGIGWLAPAADRTAD